MKRSYLQKEREKIRELSVKAAIQYVWDYYKLWIIGVVVIIGVILYFVSMFGRKNPDYLLKVAFVNFYDNVSDHSEFEMEFIDCLKEQTEVDASNVEFDSNYYFNLKKESDYSNSYYQKLLAYLEAGTVDAAVVEYSNLKGIGQSGRFLDLKDARVNSLREKYENRLVSIETDEGEIFVGIDISDSPVLNQMNTYSDSCYLAVSSKATHIDMVEAFVDYLLCE